MLPVSRSVSLRAAALAASLIVGGAGPALAQPAASPALDALSARASTQGSVKVIISLAVATRPEASLSAGAVGLQRAAIASAQSAMAAQVLANTQSRVKRNFETVPSVAAEVDANALARLRASPLVQSIQEDALAEPSLLQSTALVNAPTAWNRGYTGTNWAVAVLDTGVDKNHVFLSGKVVSEACYSSTVTGGTMPSNSVCPGGAPSSTAVNSGLNCTGSTDCDHGTHVAGIAAGGTNPNDGSHGMAYGGNIIAMQVFSLFPNYQGSGATRALSYTSDQMAALERVYALRTTYNIAAINMSLGGGQVTGACDTDSRKPIIDNLRAAGIATVIAAGNSGYKTAMGAPACISSAISVAASCDASSTSTCVTGVNGIASYSNISTLTSLVAPGSFIYSSVPNNGWASFNGTSMAAPHVAGAWAMYKHWQPTVSVSEALANFQANGLVVNDTRSGGTVSGKSRIDMSFVGGSTPVLYGLTVARAGTSSTLGTVTSSPAGINCGSDCAEDYTSGTSVTLSAAAGAGASFAGWSGACTGTAATCTVSMTAARSVTATFNTAMPRFTLTVTKAGTGASRGTVSSSPAGISCGADCTEPYDAGAAVTLRATVSGRATFTGWTGACSGTMPSCVVTMDAAKSVTATFAR